MGLLFYGIVGLALAPPATDLYAGAFDRHRPATADQCYPAMCSAPRPAGHLVRRQYSPFALELEFDDERIMPQPLHALEMDFEPELPRPYTAPGLSPNLAAESNAGEHATAPPRPKIRKPEGESGRSGPRGYNLKTTLNWEEGLYEKVLVRTAVCYYGRADRSLPP